MSFRWTQKLMAELAADERRELGLGIMDPLDPYELAERHGVPVYAISDLEASGCTQSTIKHFLATRKDAWSAAIIPVGPSQIIIENDAHDHVRQRSNLAHEMSHHLLEHAFPDTLLTQDHDRSFSPKVEKEALYLSGELLIPDRACVKLAFKGADNHEVGARFEVSTHMAQMRMKGARVLAENALKKQARAQR